MAPAALVAVLAFWAQACHCRAAWRRAPTWPELRQVQQTWLVSKRGRVRRRWRALRALPPVRLQRAMRPLVLGPVLAQALTRVQVQVQVQVQVRDQMFRWRLESSVRAVCHAG